MGEALDTQVGGDHYKRFKIQPGVFCHLNQFTLFEGNVIKYVTRHQFKNGRQDLEKAKHCAQLIIDVHNEYDHPILPVNDKYIIAPEDFCTENNLDTHQTFVVFLMCSYRKRGVSKLHEVIQVIDTMIKVHYEK